MPKLLQINLSYTTTMRIKESIKDNESSVFDEAQHEIEFLMESDPYKRFILASL